MEPAWRRRVCTRATSSTSAKSGCVWNHARSRAAWGRRCSGNDNEMKRFRTKIFGRPAMSDEQGSETTAPPKEAKGGRFLGSLKEALANASRDDTQRGGKRQP